MYLLLHTLSVGFRAYTSYRCNIFTDINVHYNIYYKKMYYFRVCCKG